MQSGKLKELLDSLYLKYHNKLSSKDPVWVLHEFTDARDIEIIGLLTAVYAYGQVDQINKFINRLLKNIGGNPYEFTINFQKRKDKKFLRGLAYRFNAELDIINLFDSLNRNLKEYGSLKNLFLSGYSKNDDNIIKGLANFSSAFKIKPSPENRYYHYLVTNPENNSTCKRMNLYLRWMIRKDRIDSGIWNEIPTSKLIMPVDTHIARISKKLRLVKRKSIDLKFAIELTERLKKFDADDPVKYDFALCHVGIDKQLLITN